MKISELQIHRDSLAGWVSTNKSHPNIGNPDCLYVDTCGPSGWTIGITGSSYKERISKRVFPNDTKMEPLIRHALETKEFYALADYMIERYPEHPVTELLTEIVMEKVQP